MPGINSNQIKYQPDGVTEPTEEQIQTVENKNTHIAKTPEEEHSRRFQEVKDDIFRRRAKLMKRLAE